jgi:hypothetical protein
VNAVAVTPCPYCGEPARRTSMFELYEPYRREEWRQCDRGHFSVTVGYSR